MDANDYQDLKFLLDKHAERFEDAIRRLRRDVLAAGIASASATRFFVGSYSTGEVYGEVERLMAESDKRPL